MDRQLAQRGLVLLPTWLPEWVRSKLVTELLAPPVLLGISVGSVVLFVATLLLGSWAVRRLPADFLLDQDRPQKARGLALLGDVVRNLVGFLLLVVGVLMLVLPGQGLLTILAALSLMDFPGKRKLERRLILLPRVLNTVNRLRERAGAPPLRVPNPKVPPSASQPR
jgi:putative transmembrane protein PGPGW